MNFPSLFKVSLFLLAATAFCRDIPSRGLCCLMIAISGPVKLLVFTPTPFSSLWTKTLRFLHLSVYPLASRGRLRWLVGALPLLSILLPQTQLLYSIITAYGNPSIYILILGFLSVFQFHWVSSSWVFYFSSFFEVFLRVPFSDHVHYNYLECLLKIQIPSVLSKTC